MAIEISSNGPTQAGPFWICGLVHPYHLEEFISGFKGFWWMLSCIEILVSKQQTLASGYKTFFMLNSVEHEILVAH